MPRGGASFAGLSALAFAVRSRLCGADCGGGPRDLESNSTVAIDLAERKEPAARRRALNDRRSTGGRGRNLRRRTQSRQCDRPVASPPLYFDPRSRRRLRFSLCHRRGRKIAVLEITVGRDVGELAKLFDSAIPGNEIQVKTIGGSIILTGSVASAAEAQKAQDIAEGFLSDAGGTTTTAPPARRAPPRASTSPVAATALAPAAAAVATATRQARHTSKIVNALTIRGLDQVSLRVPSPKSAATSSNSSASTSRPLGAANGLTSLNLTNPFSSQWRDNARERDAGLDRWDRRRLPATLQAYEQQGVARTLAEPTVTAISGESAKFLAGGTVPIPNSETCAPNGIANVCTIGIIQQPYGVSLAFTPVVLSQNRIQLRIATEVTDVDPSKTITVQNDRGPRIPHAQERDDRRTAVGRFDRHGRLDLLAVGGGDQRLARPDEPAGSRRAVPFARLSAPGDASS